MGIDQKNLYVPAILLQSAASNASFLALHRPTSKTNPAQQTLNQDSIFFARETLHQYVICRVDRFVVWRHMLREANSSRTKLQVQRNDGSSSSNCQWIPACVVWSVGGGGDEFYVVLFYSILCVQ